MAFLVNQGSRSRYNLNIFAIQHLLIIDLLRSNNRYLVKHIDFLKLLLLKKAFNLNEFVGVGDASIDGKLSMNKSHPLTVALDDTSDEKNMAKSNMNGR